MHAVCPTVHSMGKQAQDKLVPWSLNTTYITTNMQLVSNQKTICELITSKQGVGMDDLNHIAKSHRHTFREMV